MSVRLVIFAEIAVLRVRRSIGARQVQVLAAGIRRVFDSGVKVVLVDVRGAELDDAAAAAARSVVPAVCKNTKGIRVVIVTPDVRIGEFPDMNAASGAIEIAEKKDLLAWLEAEDELDVLLARKAELEAKMGTQGEEGRKRVRQARGERARVARMKEGISGAMALWGRRLSLWKKIPSEADSGERLKQALTELKRERKAAA